MTNSRLHQALFLGMALAVSLLCPLNSFAADIESTADHSKFDELQQAFKTGPEVTKACLGCHTEAAKQLHKTTPWT